MQKTEQNNLGINDVEFYILKYNAEKQDRLFKIRSAVFEKFPNASERIYYGIPTVELDGKIILHYAAYKNHISIIVCYELAALLQEKYPQYQYTRATVIFTDNKPFPYEFIKEICTML